MQVFDYRVNVSPRSDINVRCSGLDGFVDASTLLGPGIFVLMYRGRCQYVGRATSGMLAKLAALRANDRPSWLARFTFDQIFIRRVHPDSLRDTYFATVTELRPIHNTDLTPPPSLPIVARRSL